MAGEVDYTINACSYGSASFPCFNMKKSINNLMITNNRWFTIFLDFKVMSTRHLLNSSPQCPLKLDLEVKVDLGRYFCQFCCTIQVILMPNCHVRCSRCKCAPQFDLRNFISMATYWVPEYWKHFWPALAFNFHICKWCLIYMVQQAYKYVSLSLWPFMTFFELKIAYIWKWSGRGLEKSELPWQENVL